MLKPGSLKSGAYWANSKNTKPRQEHFLKDKEAAMQDLSDRLYQLGKVRINVKQLWQRIIHPMTNFEKIWLAIFSAIILASTFYFSYTGTDWADWKSIGLNWVISPVSA